MPLLPFFVVSLVSANVCEQHKTHYRENCCSPTSQCYLYKLNSQYTSNALNEISKCDSNSTCFSEKTAVQKLLLLKISSSAFFSNECDPLISDEIYDALKESFLLDIGGSYALSNFKLNSGVLTHEKVFMELFNASSLVEQTSQVQYLSHAIHSGQEVFPERPRIFANSVLDYTSSLLVHGVELTNQLAVLKSSSFSLFLDLLF